MSKFNNSITPVGGKTTLCGLHFDYPDPSFEVKRETSFVLIFIFFKIAEFDNFFPCLVCFFFASIFQESSHFQISKAKRPMLCTRIKPEIVKCLTEKGPTPRLNNIFGHGTAHLLALGLRSRMCLGDQIQVFSQICWGKWPFLQKRPKKLTRLAGGVKERQNMAQNGPHFYISLASEPSRGP